MSKVPPNADLVYHIGMNYMQKAMSYRSEGQIDKAEQYMKKFQVLCDYIVQGIETIPELGDKDVFNLIDNVNKSRQTMISELKDVAKTKDTESITELKGVIDVQNRSLQVLSKCLELHYKPPVIETNNCEVVVAKGNTDIPPSIVRCTIKNIGAQIKKGTLYKLKCYGIRQDDEPICSELIQAGPCDFQVDWSIIRRNKPDAIKRLIKNKKLTFELEMHEKGLFKSTVLSVGYVQVPLNLFANIETISKVYTLETTPNTPKDQSYSLSIVFQLSAPLLGTSLSAKKLSYLRIKKGSAATAPLPPGAKCEEAPKAVTRKMEELTKEELKILNSKLPKAGNMTFRALDDWELERWMSNDLLNWLISESKKATDVFSEMGVAVPPKLSGMSEKLQKKLAINQNGLKKGKISLQQYVAIMTKQVNEDMKEAKTRGLETVVGKNLLYRTSIMKKELEKYQKKK